MDCCRWKSCAGYQETEIEGVDMMKTYVIRERKLSELERMDGEIFSPEDYLYVDQLKVRALNANPFLWQVDSPAQEVGFVNGVAGGYNFIFPIDFCFDGIEYGGATGSSLNVQEWARSSSMGLELPVVGTDRSAKDAISVAASCSKMAIPVHQINGYKFFMMPRFIALWKSRSVLERFMGTGIMTKIFSRVIDAVLCVWAIVLGWAVKVKLRGLAFDEVLADDPEGMRQIAGLVAQDGHRFREMHDERWFKWHVTQSFSVDGPSRAFVIKRKGSPIAFIMFKKRFHAQASHRGFRNVWIGSINEWGAAKDEESILPWCIARAALDFRKDGMDVCEFVTVDPMLQKFVGRLGWCHVGESNYGVKVWSKSPLIGQKQDLLNPDNWRLRPAMGDNGLS